MAENFKATNEAPDGTYSRQSLLLGTAAGLEILYQKGSAMNDCSGLNKMYPKLTANLNLEDRAVVNQLIFDFNKEARASSPHIPEVILQKDGSIRFPACKSDKQ